MVRGLGGSRSWPILYVVNAVLTCHRGFHTADKLRRVRSLRRLVFYGKAMLIDTTFTCFVSFTPSVSGHAEHVLVHRLRLLLALPRM